MDSYCKKCDKTYDGKWDKCPKCGVSVKKVKNENKEKMPKSEEQRTYIEKTKLAAGNTENDFANMKRTLKNINTTLEKLDRGNLSQMSEHLSWLALSAQIGLVFLFISILIMILSIF